MALLKDELFAEAANNYRWPSIFVLVLVIAAIAISWQFPGRKDDPRGPPIIAVSSIGHIIGMMRYQGSYLKSLSQRFMNWPIFTLKIFGTSIHVVSSPDLAQSVLCNTKSISFMPFHIAFTNRALGARQEIKDIVAKDSGYNPYMNAIHQGMHSSLAYGPSLTETNRRILTSMANYVNDISTTKKTCELFQWMKHVYTIGLAEGFYGPDNPITNNPSYVQHIWDFEQGIPTLWLNVFPRITARKAYAARRTLTPAFKEYYDKGLDKNANEFIKGRARAARVEGWTNNDLAGFEITICFSALTNTVPNALSLLCHVLENPTLYADIREEVKKVTTKETVGDIEHATIDITAFNDKCPVLISSYWENIRLCVNGTPVRVATEDVTLKDAYNIEKGGILLATGGAMQESKKVWGSDADQFNGRRFLSDNVTREQQKHMLPFGGGKHLCPGRHLAFTEIVSFVALIVYGYEIEMRDGSKLVHAGFKTQLAGENSKKPLRELNVTIRRKEEFKGVIWAFEVGSGGV